MTRAKRIVALVICVSLLTSICAVAFAVRRPGDQYICECGGIMTCGNTFKGELLRQYTKYENGAHYLYLVYETKRTDTCSKGHSVVVRGETTEKQFMGY